MNMLNYVRQFGASATRIGRWIAPLAVVVVLASVAAACPTCKDGIGENDPLHQSTAAGFYYSILFMMSMPYILLGTLGYVAYSSVKKAKLNQAAECNSATSDV